MPIFPEDNKIQVQHYRSKQIKPLIIPHFPNFMAFMKHDSRYWVAERVDFVNRAVFPLTVYLV